MRLEQLEVLAAEIMAEAGLKPPVSAFLLADALGLDLTPVGGFEEGVYGREIRFNARRPHREQQESVMRFVARYVLERNGFYATDHSVARLSRALMLPLEPFVADARRGRTFEWLLARYPHASEAQVGARMGELAGQQRRARAPHALTR
jgi:hypothetical protein